MASPGHLQRKKVDLLIHFPPRLTHGHRRDACHPSAFSGCVAVACLGLTGPGAEAEREGELRQGQNRGALYRWMPGSQVKGQREEHSRTDPHWQLRPESTESHKPLGPHPNDTPHAGH